jgi:hypothetical protein
MAQVGVGQQIDCGVTYVLGAWQYHGRRPPGRL